MAQGRSTGYTAAQLYAAFETYLTCPLSPFREGRELLAVDCSRCGNCCRRPWRVEVDLQDVLRWACDGRHDLIAALERRPRKRGDEGAADPVLIRQLAAKLAGAADADLVTALTVANGVQRREGSYVLPYEGRCRYLIEGTITACSIYDIRPGACRLFPGIR